MVLIALVISRCFLLRHDMNSKRNSFEGHLEFPTTEYELNSGTFIGLLKIRSSEYELNSDRNSFKGHLEVPFEYELNSNSFKGPLEVPTEYELDSGIFMGLLEICPSEYELNGKLLSLGVFEARGCDWPFSAERVRHRRSISATCHRAGRRPTRFLEPLKNNFA